MKTWIGIGLWCIALSIATIGSDDDCGCTGLPKVDVNVATMTVTLTASVGGFGYSDGAFHTPARLAAVQRSFIVADLRNRRIQQFRDSGTFESTTQAIKTSDGDDTTFQAPFAIAVDPRGAVYVGDLDENVIYRLDTYGRTQATLGAFGGAGVKFNQPMGLHVDVDGYLWVADSGNNRVLKLDNQGKKVLEIGALTGGLSDPVDVWVGADRRVWILDETGLSVCDEFGRDRRLVIPATDASSVAQWTNGVWVLTFPLQGAVKFYSAEGALLRTITEPFVSPIDAMPIGDDRLLISDRGAHRIWVFTAH